MARLKEANIKLAESSGTGVKGFKISRKNRLIIKVEFINNWIYKGSWNRFIYAWYNKDSEKNSYIMVGLLNFFIFLTWKPKRV